MKKNTLIKLGMFSFITASAVLAANSQKIVEAADNSTPATHIGTYDGRTTFMVSSANGVNPGLFIEVIDKDGNIAQYESEDGIITVENTRAGAYVTQAKLLGKTMYRDLDTGELLEAWEDGRNLELESSEMPTLRITGKNLLDYRGLEWMQGGLNDAGNITGTSDSNSYVTNSYIPIEYLGNVVGKQIYMNAEQSNSRSWIQMFFYDENKRVVGRILNHGQSAYLPCGGVVPETAKYFRIGASTPDLGSVVITLQKSEAFPYAEHQSSVLTTSENITLHSVGNVRDGLDLATGEYVQHVDEIVVDGTQNLMGLGRDTDIAYTRYLGAPNKKGHGKAIADKLPKSDIYQGNIGFNIDWNGCLLLGVPKDEADAAGGVNNYFKANPLTVKYEVNTPVVRMVNLITDGYFSPETSAQLSIKGETVPLIASITVPTETLSFVIDPNQEVDQQFIAPEFSVTNDTYAPLKLEIKSFTQLTNTMNDVLPSEHSDWTTLGKQESNDIALAVAPKPGSGWKSLTEGERYVADNSNYELGVINPAETVEFSFSALHGPTITKPINLQYTLGLIFDFE